jgi:hypothetical protein
MNVMMACGAILTAAPMFLIGAGLGIAQHEPQPVIAEKGNWKVTLPVPANAAQDQFVLSTAAIDQNAATFHLSCRSDPQVYYFAVQDARLAELSWGKQAAIEMRLSNQEPVRFQAASRGDGSIVIQERVQQTAFTLIHNWLLHGGTSNIGLAVGKYQWVFSLDGFAALMDLLAERCGYAPDPARALGRGR